MCGSAHNTLLSCKELCDKYEIILLHGLSHESLMTDTEKQNVNEGVRAAKTRGVKFISLPSMVRSIRPFKDFRAMLSLVELIFKERPDIVHTHSSKGTILGRLAAKIAGVPLVIHSPHGHVFYSHFGPIASKIFLWVEKIFSRFTDCLVALTDGKKEHYIEMSVCAPENLLTSHSGVDVQQFLNANVNPVEKKRSPGFGPKESVVAETVTSA